MRIACDILYKYSEVAVLNMLRMGLFNLGFTPNYYNVFFNQFKKPKNNVVFNETNLNKLFTKSNRPRSITIFDKMYDDNSLEDNVKWFRLSINFESDVEYLETIGNSILLEWSNSNLEFLFQSTIFNNIISDKNLIYCYIYNQNDLMKQSNTIYNEFEENKTKNKLIKNEYGDIEIDISENWGRYERIRSVTFLAGSKMYFGQGFNPISNLEKMLKFKFAKPLVNTVEIELYPIDKDPVQYRDIQKLYWEFINESKTKFENDNKLDFTKWLFSKAKKNKYL